MKLQYHSKSRRGVALVIVLSVLVLLSALIIGFMSSVSTERTATSVNSALITARQLNDTAVNLVIEQIREATSCYKPGTDEPDESTTWASQPGAITTISGEIGTKKNLLLGAHDWTYKQGANDFVFKLYSAKKLKVSLSDYRGADLKEETDVIDLWDPIEPRKADEFGDFVDINEPLFVPVGDVDDEDLVEPRYQIFNAAARLDENGGRVQGDKNGVVQGFDAKRFDHPTLKQKFRKPDGTYTQARSVPLLPMPVRWLYQLKDGTLSASVNGRVQKASKNNPIVGRVAFWTDDESCKLNVNTASEGTYWDTPSASSSWESGSVSNSGTLLTNPGNSNNLASAQPVRGEYQRYPGHPATTCLSPVFGWLWDLDPNLESSKQEALEKTRKFKEAMASMAPFLPYGTPPDIRFGSPTTQGGFKNPDPDTPLPSVLQPGEMPILNVLTRRLYPTVDEYLLNADRFKLTDTLTANRPNPLSILNDKDKFKLSDATDSDRTRSSRLSAEALDRLRGFITANSRSPEVNVFGRPRITHWPVSMDLNFRTAFDELFAFTSTIGGFDKSLGRVNPALAKRFFFARWDAKNRTNDYAAIPAAADYPNANPDPNLRLPGGKTVNQDMHEYLEALTGGSTSNRNGTIATEIPGFGGSFLTKYPKAPGGVISDRSQIIAEIMDYIRSVNLVDTGEGRQTGTAFRSYTPRFYPKPEWQVPGDIYSRLQRSQDGAGQVTPLRLPAVAGTRTDDGAQGMGRFVVISDAAVVFYRTTLKEGNVTKPAMQAALIMNMATTMPGFPAIRETFYTRVSEVVPNKVTLGANEKNLGFPTQRVININNMASQEVGYGRGFMPTLGYISQLHYFPAHSAPTTVNPAGRNSSMAVKAKVFKNDDGASIVYRRGLTETIYPYVSNLIDISDSTKPAPPAGQAFPEVPNFIWKGGTFVVEIYSGEAPDDPKSQLVQTVTLRFPDQPITFDKVTAASTPLQSRLTGALDGAWNIFTAGDVSRGIEFVGTDASGAPLPAPSNNANTSSGQRGDLRLAAARPVLGPNDYRPREEGASSAYFTPSVRLLHGLRTGHGDPCTGFSSLANASWGRLGKGTAIRNSKPPILPVGINGVQTYNGVPGDWDRGISKHMSGAFGNKVDEGNIYFRYTESSGGRMPYYRGRAIEETGQSFFSPNRQLPSAVMFGSLPTGVMNGRPWQTLLFRPDRNSTSQRHPGDADASRKAPPDHLWLDLFHLPIVEPYAISEPFSTAGKVNLNYVIAPFGYAKGDAGSNPGTDGQARSYIRRDTALRGVLKSVKIMAVPTTQDAGGHTEDPLTQSTQFRWDINLDRTLALMEDRLKDKDRGLFRTASEICNIDLHPQMTSKVTNWGTFWDTTYGLTGDNMRERPYSHIYPRVTTKSNVYTVHVRAQAILKAANTDPERFEEGRDTVAGEYRGSTIVERYIDPNDPNLRNYDWSAASGLGRLDPYYRFRIVGTKQFTAH